MKAERYYVAVLPLSSFSIRPNLKEMMMDRADLVPLMRLATAADVEAFAVEGGFDSAAAMYEEVGLRPGEMVGTVQEAEDGEPEGEVTACGEGRSIDFFGKEYVATDGSRRVGYRIYDSGWKLFTDGKGALFGLCIE